MSGHQGSGEFKEQDSPDSQHLDSKTSSHLEKTNSKERQKEKANKKLRSPRSGKAQFVSNDKCTSSPRKHCISVTKKSSKIHQPESSALAKAKVSKSLHLCTEKKHKMESWKISDDLEKARDAHHRKFQATLDSLVEEFESGAFSTWIQNIKTQRVRFRVHYVTQSSRQTLAVTGNHHNLGAWKSFVPLRKAEDGFWFCSIVFPLDIQVEWKFVLVEDGEIVHWEECSNRRVEVLRKVEEVIQLHCTWGYH